jgi:hypothetical protein
MGRESGHAWHGQKRMRDHQLWPASQEGRDDSVKANPPVMQKRKSESGKGVSFSCRKRSWKISSCSDPEPPCQELYAGQRSVAGFLARAVTPKGHVGCMTPPLQNTAEHARIWQKQIGWSTVAATTPHLTGSLFLPRLIDHHPNRWSVKTGMQ